MAARSNNKSSIPVKHILDILKSGKGSSDAAQESIGVHILFDPAADSLIVDTIKRAFLAEKIGAAVMVGMLGESPVLAGNPDICIIVSGGSDDLTAPAVKHYAGRSIPVGVVCESSLMVPSLDIAAEHEALVGLIASSDPADIEKKLAAWVVKVTNTKLAFPANFPFLREEAVNSLINSCAAQNAAIGAVALIPGADMPLMTTNQAKLALDIAAVYGEDLAPERIPELAGVVGAGFAYRALARQLLGVLPGVGVVIKAGMGYGGTLATGRALSAHFSGSSSKESKGGFAALEKLQELRHKLSRSSKKDDASSTTADYSAQNSSSGALVPIEHNEDQ